MKVLASDGKPIRAQPFGVLEEHRLVRIHTQTSALASQEITITAAGKLALDTQNPGRAPAASPAKVPKARADGRHR